MKMPIRRWKPVVGRCSFGAAIVAGILLLVSAAPPAVAMENPAAYYGRWSNGIPSDPNYFPIAVWLQDPSNATAYKTNASINLFIGLWQGPTESQLTALQSTGMPVLCDQNAIGLAHLSNKTIMGWLQEDEPDNAQPDGSGGYGPPVATAAVVSIYNTFKSNDPSRPVFLNLGQGVAWDGWYGRGVRTNHPEDYYGYVMGGDIVAFDIYPVNSSDAAVSGNLWYVPQGIDRLRTYTGDAKPVWCWIECTKINASSPAKPTAQQVRSEVWMALIHGANGIGYFCHSWTPSFDETALLHDSSMLAAVKTLNQQVQSLAPALNSSTIANLVTVTSNNSAVPIDILVKQYGGATYVFAAAMRNGSATGTFTLPFGTSATVLGESRQVSISNGIFSDSFVSNDVHLYKIDSIGDLDADGMPDWWETKYFGGTNTVKGGAQEDWDQDGMSNLDEYLAGTSPTNAASVLRISTLAKVAGTGLSTISWSAVPGKTYQVLYSDSPGGSWSDTLPGSLMTAQTGQTSLSYTDTTHSSELMGFYKIKLVP